HETFPIYYHPDVLRVITNAVRWAAPGDGPVPVFGHAKPLEHI
ncbi:MAG: trehalose utilization protein ThuA, partial [Candidatus Latescibacteria bacterium 4484_107]